MAAPAGARAHDWVPGVCGLPTALPLQVEYAEVAVSPAILGEVFGPARPSLVLATSGRTFPEQLRELGAHTVFWQMKLERLIGGTSSAALAESIEPAADQLYERAVRETGCAFPTIALNELQGNWLPTPWSVMNAQYRDNALRLLRRLHERGAHPYLLVTTTPRPFTGSEEAARWWQEAAAVSDLVLQVHFDGRFVYRHGPAAGSRLRRTKMRSVLDQFESIGIPAGRLGLLHGFQSGAGSGGREGLPLNRWLRVVKWEVLATKHVVAERAAEGEPIGSDWSWGWGDFPKLSRVDPDKHVTACVYLWARDSSLCDGPGRAASWGAPFNTSVTEGQLQLPVGIHCSLGRRGAVIAGATLETLAAALTRGPIGRRAAPSALLTWSVTSRNARLRAADVLRAERGVVRRSFAGDRDAYLAALEASKLPLELARAAIADQLRRRKIARGLPRGLVPRLARRRAGGGAAGDHLPARRAPGPGRGQPGRAPAVPPRSPPPARSGQSRRRAGPRRPTRRSPGSARPRSGARRPCCRNAGRASGRFRAGSRTGCRGLRAPRERPRTTASAPSPCRRGGPGHGGR